MFNKSDLLANEGRCLNEESTQRNRIKTEPKSEWNRGGCFGIGPWEARGGVPPTNRARRERAAERRERAPAQSESSDGGRRRLEVLREAW